MMSKFNFSIILSLCYSLATFAQNNNEIPHLVTQGNATQLVVNQQPMLILGGELGNSSSSTMDYMRPIWNKVKNNHLNTVIAPVYWELIEPVEGQYNFDLVDSLIFEARNHQLKLVFLWFGAWKNSMSCYAPLWVKKDYNRFPRAKSKEGKAVEIMSPFSANNLSIDQKVFAAFMKHIKQVDAKEQTVVMIQVENEIGMLPSARDYSVEAEKAFKSAVPKELVSYLQKNSNALEADLAKRWKENGLKTSGNWEEVFGKSVATDEFFMAWYYAAFTNSLTQAGKKEYPIPMYVNAALNRPNKLPGEYPSAGPLPHLFDLWKAAGTSIDFLSPDIYYPDFAHWTGLYKRKNNPLFIPEANKDTAPDAKAFYAMGQHEAIGFSPFSVEDISEKEYLGRSYAVLEELTPLILEKQGKGLMAGVLLDGINQKDTLYVGDYKLIASHEYTLGWSPKAKEKTTEWETVGAMIIQLAPDEFVIAGAGVVFTFEPKTAGEIAGIAQIDEGHYKNGKWIAGRRMNGDQDHQGRHLRFTVGDYGIQRIKLYNYK